jgi:hypothetical protein
MTHLLLSEVVEQTKKLKSNADKAEFLKKHAGRPLFYLLWLAFSDKVEWTLPEGLPPFQPWEEQRGGRNRPGSEPSELKRELRRLYLFLKGTGDNLSRLKRERLFQSVLETIPKSDALLLGAVKDKKFSTEYKFSKKLLDEVFPGLLDAPFTNKFVG